MIEIFDGIEIGAGITMGDVSVLPTYFVTESGADFLVTESGDNFIAE